MAHLRTTALRGIAGLLILVSVLPAALAGGFSNPDFGVRRQGMFAVVARPDDVTAIYHNPAGLTLGRGTRLYHAQYGSAMEIGFDYLWQL